jgi:hypothetical protein
LINRLLEDFFSFKLEDNMEVSVDRVLAMDEYPEVSRDIGGWRESSFRVCDPDEETEPTRWRLSAVDPEANCCRIAPSIVRVLWRIADWRKGGLEEPLS